MSTLEIGFLVFPKITQLDFTAPLQVLSRLPDVRTHFVAQTMEAVDSDCGLAIVPNRTFADCPDLDVICVPGGFGVVEVMKSVEALDFLRRQAGRAKYVTSVCTGAFALGAAGLLRGREATTHWGYTHLLPLVGAVHKKARVVRDGNFFTAGGITAGLDFGLTVAAELAGEAVAKTIQLGLEYDPAPPFDAGDPGRAPQASVATLRERYEPLLAAYRQGIASAAVHA